MSPLSLLVFFLVITLGGASLPETPSTTVIVAANSCEEPIWIAVVSAPNSPELLDAATGFVVYPGESAGVSVASNWTGYVWARTRCGLHNTEEEFTWLTGDCGSCAVACPRGTPVPRATTVAHFEATLVADASYLVSYKVSMATGFNLAMSVTPKDGSGPRCRPTGCSATDLNKACPKDFRVVDENNGETIGCYHDGLTSNTFGCSSAIYHIQFCSRPFPTYLPNFVEYKPYNTSEIGFDQENNNESSGNKIGTALKIGGPVSGSAIIIVILWSIIKRNRRRDEGCCNVPISMICCNDINLETNPINPNNSVALTNIKVIVGNK